VLGQAQLTYIIAQGEKGLVLVDQHAAHERVAFEKLMAAWKGGQIEVQGFLLPVTISLEAAEVEAIVPYVSDLQKLGLEVEISSPTVLSVRSAPALLKESAIAEGLRKFAQEVAERGGSFAVEKAIGDICASMACHSVVRAGQPLSLEQMRELLAQMDDFALSSFCPHGRPVSVEWSWPQLEREFGRLV
jgi:DNA mismatch repair protein MutL